MSLGPIIGGLIDDFLPVADFYPVMLVIVPLALLIYFADRKKLNGAVAHHRAVS